MIRFIVLGLLFYFLYRLLFGDRRAPVSRPQSRTAAEYAPPVQDVLIEDPVCHVYIPQGQAVTCQQGGRTYYFCGDACRSAFLSQQQPSE